jgi:ATP-dependent Zn protease
LSNNGKTLSLLNENYVTNIEKKKVKVYGTKKIEKTKERDETSFRWKIRLDVMKYVIFGFIRSDIEYNWNSEAYDEYSVLCCKEFIFLILYFLIFFILFIFLTQKNKNSKKHNFYFHFKLLFNYFFYFFLNLKNKVLMESITREENRWLLHQLGLKKVE